MNGTDDSGRTARALWLRSRETDAPEDEAGRLLDLAAFAEGRLDDEETGRIAALLAADADAASDVAAARASSLPPFAEGAAIERVIARARSLPTVPAPRSRGVLLFVRPALLRRAAVRGMAQWTSLAAALAMVGWLGFAMGSHTSLALGQPSQPSFLNQLIDPDTGVLRDFSAELRA